MATYELNEAAVAYAKELIRAKKYVLDSDWGRVQPSAEEQNAFLAKHSWDEYAGGTSASPWARTTRPRPGTALSMATFRRLHRTGLIACVYRASEWRHKAIELAAHDLLQLLDEATLSTKTPAGTRKAR